MRKIILDCDPGMDDSMAIVMAAKAPEIHLLAVTTVNGNYPVDVTCVNARKMLELIGRTDIPVGRGLEWHMPLILTLYRQGKLMWEWKPKMVLLLA